MHFQRVKIEGQVTNFVVGCEPFTASHDRFYSCYQFWQVEWFDQIVICAQLKALQFVFQLITGGEHDDWGSEFRFLTQSTADFKAVDAWQHNVQDNDVVTFCHC